MALCAYRMPRHSPVQGGSSRGFVLQEQGHRAFKTTSQVLLSQLYCLSSLPIAGVTFLLCPHLPRNLLLPFHSPPFLFPLLYCKFPYPKPPSQHQLPSCISDSRTSNYTTHCLLPIIPFYIRHLGKIS